MEIIHVSAECYPVAKTGGLGDVVGALPKYLSKLGHTAKVVIPMYRTRFLLENEWELVHEGGQFLGPKSFHYSVIREKSNKLGFDLYLLDINGLLDRENVYGYDDDTERFTSFQIAVCDWISHWEHQPDIIHVHDHHAGFIPFMVNYCKAFEVLKNIPTILTIHNAQYQGVMAWDKSYYLPAYDTWKATMLEWNKAINPLASAIKCAWKVNTVSWSYLEELKQSANGLENLFEYEKGKCSGILNGIDSDFWNPETDEFLVKNYSIENFEKGKRKNKKELCKRFNLDQEKPLFVFIGRLVGEKAADILPEAISSSIYQQHGNCNFLILGSGDKLVENQLETVKHQLSGYVNTYIGYNEQLSHLMYAGADFLLMPSRVEPCGLNQLYALRYGTVPMVRNTGGLRDTVIDFGDWEGFGIRFDNATVWDITYSVGRAIDLFFNKKIQLNGMIEQMMQIDHSWESSTNQYISLYKSVI
ncbi:MAG TPA: glycogen synthase [Chitinophagaceae bacterium]|nr:glycogen synthase [Chitinophagaceae bacterium]